MFHVDGDTVMWRVLDGEAVIVHADTAQYYGTNLAGAVLWARLVGGNASERDLVDALTSRFAGVSDADVAAAVAGFLDTAVEADLVIEGEAPGGAADAPQIEAPEAPFELPSLVRFGDLEALVLSGE